MKAKRATLATAPRYQRLAAQAGEPVAVDRKGGRRKSGLIRGASLLTKGEALGHGLWLDDEFVDSVVAGVNKFNQGVKSRFTHPGLSADGLATHLGRAMNAQRQGDQAIADLHFTATSHSTPDGDLSGYVMDLADESPEDVAISIVYGVDFEAEKAHFLAHGGKVIGDPYYGEYWDDSEFQSPDPANAQNLPHARLAEMRAADFVGDPAANPAGLFGREAKFAQEAESLAAFSLGLSQERPEAVALGLDAERVRQFVTRFLTQHNLEIAPMRSQNQKPAQRQQDSTPPTDETVATPTEESPAATPAEETPVADPVAPQLSAARAEAARFRTAFGEQGAVWFADGLSWEQAQARFSAGLATAAADENRKLSDRLTALEAQLKAAGKATGEESAAGFQSSDGKKYSGFAGKIRFAGQPPKAA